MPEEIVAYSLVSWSCSGQINRQKNPMAVSGSAYVILGISVDIT